MAANFPGPFTLDFTYTVDGLQHRMSTNLGMSITADIGDPFTAWTIANRSMVAITLKVYSDTLIGLLRVFHNTAVTFDTATLFSVIPLTFDKVWQSEETIGLLGTQVSAFSLAKQRIITYRTLEGGVSKIVLMESVNILDNQRGPAAYTPEEIALSAFILDLDSAMLGRDTSFLIADIRASDGQNEKTWRQRNRP